MPGQRPLVAEALCDLSTTGDPVEVSLSNELVRLLSEQLYQSPLKAIEELVVNAYDAEAEECRLYVPLADEDSDFIIVYDDGQGMDRDGLVNLWQIGRSNKRNEEIELRSKRKLIGKFGIGKLATYTIANRLTYITKARQGILSVTIDFRLFLQSPTGSGEPVRLPVWEVVDWAAFVEQAQLQARFGRAGMDALALGATPKRSWTVAILEDLKEKTKKITQGRLQWVLSTAMPLREDFRLFLNGEQVVSAKESYTKVVEFDLGELPARRLQSLKDATGDEWRVREGLLASPAFPAGVSGSVFVTERTLEGKSDDLERSHGFFIRVRDRLVNEGDPLFGQKALIHGTFNRFRADIRADDLDKELKSSRETVEESGLKEEFRTLLREVFNEAYSRYEEYLRGEDKKGSSKREGERTVVAPHLVEHPVADALLTQYDNPDGTEADEGWFYLDVAKDVDLASLVQALYTAPRNSFRYQYTRAGSTARLVKFDPVDATFRINEDHELAKEYAGESEAKYLLEDFVTAEALLEVYLRESRVPAHVVGEVLEKRDALLRSLVKDHAYSAATISKLLRDSAADEHELEIALVVAARALGFVAKHHSGAGEPDGVARFIAYPNGEKKITLEAKSSAGVPSLGAIDFAGLEEHISRYSAHGCLLIAPSYPGASRDEESAAAARAVKARVSCWTVEQLARFVSVAEARQLTAEHVLQIVLNKFSPHEVSEAIDALLAQPTWDNRALFRAILKALRDLEGKIPDRLRSVDMVTAMVAAQPNFGVIEGKIVEAAVAQLAGASQGAITLTDHTILIHVSLEEVERRVAGLTKQPGDPRKVSNFRKT